MGVHKVTDMPHLLLPGEKISCLTCHENLAAAREKLVRTVLVEKKQMDVCDASRAANDAARMALAHKRADEQEAQRQKEAQTRAKQPNVMPQKAPQGKKP